MQIPFFIVWLCYQYEEIKYLKIKSIFQGKDSARVALLVMLRLSIWVGQVAGPHPVLGELIGSTGPQSARERMELVRRILSEVPLIDGHNDLPWNIRNFVHNQLAEFDFDTDLRQVVPWSKSAWSQTDLPRLRQGMVGGQVSSNRALINLIFYPNNYP